LGFDADTISLAVNPGYALPMITVAGIELEIFERGRGEPLFYLHGGAGVGSDIPFLELIAKERRVIAPSHPGFGRSSLPDWLDSVDDINHVYLELMDRLGLMRVDLVGFSIGGWIAAEIAHPHRPRRGKNRPTGQARHSGYFRHVAGSAGPPALARSQEQPGRACCHER
jgi:pimeloyl-ACP methyl ester carboxylesterase